MRISPLSKTLSVILLVSSLSSVATYAKSHSFEKKNREKRLQKREEKKIKKRVDKLNWSASYQGLLRDNRRFFTRLKQRHENNNIIGIELIVASSSWANVESGLGHIMLRFVDDVGSASDDLVLSFVANVDTSKLNYFKGIFGGYSVFPQLKSLRLFMNEYTNTQQRDLDRYVVLSNKDIRNKLVLNLLETWKKIEDENQSSRSKSLTDSLEKAAQYSQKVYGKDNFRLFPLATRSGDIYGFATVEKKLFGKNNALTAKQMFPVEYKVALTPSLGDYTFFTNNCAGAVVNFFKEVGMPYNKSLGLKGRIPLALPKYFKKALLSPYPVVKIPSLRPLKEKVVDTLELKDESYLNYDLTPTHLEKLLPNLSNSELRKLNEVVTFSNESFPIYRDKLKTLKEKSYETTYGVKNIPKSLYNLCSSKSCLKRIKIDIDQFYGKSSFEKVRESNIKLSKKSITKRVKDNGSAIRRTIYVTPYKGHLVNKDIIKHYKTLGFLHNNWKTN